MNLKDTVTLYQASDMMGLGNVGVVSHHHGVVSKPMKKNHGHTQHVTKVKHPFDRPIAADASPSDLASHHTWLEPSSTDVTIRDWRSKRETEKRMGRNMDPFEAMYERQMYGAKEEVTGPCGCTLKVGEPVLVEGRGKGLIMSRSSRILTVAMDGDGSIQIDQKFVHRPK